MVIVTGENADWKRVKEETSKIEGPTFVCHVIVSRKAAERLYRIKECFGYEVSPENILARTIEAGMRAIETMMGSEEAIDPSKN